MKTNESGVDRGIRIVLAIVLGTLIAAKVVTGSVAIIAGVVAAIAAITGIIGSCAIYAILRISTCLVTDKKN